MLLEQHEDLEQVEVEVEVEVVEQAVVQEQTEEMQAG